jgi:HD superfamily phosphodiesterase
MDLSKDIAVAENLYREKLEVFINQIFAGKRLDSHGPEHHRRVWQYARELMGYSEIQNGINDKSFPVRVIIAAYLHDSGMSVDPGPRHGDDSRSFCEEFIAANGLDKADFTDLLEAVANHDNKDYSQPAKGSMLFNIISVADDLDALGYIGIYRYLEIYMMRGYALPELGSLIIANVNGRFRNFEAVFGNVPRLIARFRPRRETITGFFEKYNIRAKGYRFGSSDPEGYCGIAEIIESMIRSREPLADVIDSSVVSHDRVISWYFGELKKELS